MKRVREPRQEFQELPPERIQRIQGVMVTSVLHRIGCLLLGLALLPALGCTFAKPDEWDFDCSKCTEPLLPGGCPSQLEIDDPCLTGCLADETPIPVGPNAVGENNEVAFMQLTLEEAVTMALERSQVFRDLGGTVIRNPANTQTSFDPAAVYTDPQFGEEAALAAFDTTFAASMFFEKNDRVTNSTFTGAGGVLDQDLGTYNLELRKRAATGTQMSLQHVNEYDANNFIANRFGSSWQTYFDAEVRQPLLQGAGIRFNEIAGPSNQPGVMNGVLIARIRSDISLADFEIGVRNLVSNVENAYWDLYFAYYDLDAKKLARDEALALWRAKSSRVSQGDAGVDQEQQALEQYWRFESAVIDAYNGSLIVRTSTNNGSAAGSFRNPGGVRVAERQLRLIMGLPVNGVQLIKPVTNPPESPVQFDWAACATESLAQRSEIRRQRWRVKQRELELIASKNFLTPRLDMVGRYRWRGFGKDLISQSHQTGPPTYASAWGSLADGKNDEWQLGVELELPIGLRRGHAAVRNAELLLTRENAILKEQERNVLYGLSNAFGEVDRSFQVLQAVSNRLQAAEAQVRTFQRLEEEGKVGIDLLLESQRQLVDSRIRHSQARVEYVLALKNLHFEKGTILEFNDVYLAESAAPRGAYEEAAARRQRRTPNLNYISRTLSMSPGRAAESGVSKASAEVEVLPAEQIRQPMPIEHLPSAASLPAYPAMGEILQATALQEIETEPAEAAQLNSDQVGFTFLPAIRDFEETATPSGKPSAEPLP